MVGFVALACAMLLPAPPAMVKLLGGGGGLDLRRELGELEAVGLVRLEWGGDHARRREGWGRVPVAGARTFRWHRHFSPPPFLTTKPTTRTPPPPTMEDQYTHDSASRLRQHGYDDLAESLVSRVLSLISRRQRTAIHPRLPSPLDPLRCKRVRRLDIVGVNRLGCRRLLIG